MTLTYQFDVTKLQAAFEPLVILVSDVIAVNTSTITAALEVKVLIDTVHKETLYYDAISSFSTGGGNLSCSFKIDISEAVQKYLPNIEQLFLGSFSSDSYLDEEKGTISVQLKIVPYLPNTSGLLIRTPSNEVTTTAFKAIGAYLKESQTLASIYPFTNNSPRKFLSNKPNHTKVTLSDKEYLFWYDKDNEGGVMFIEFFDATSTPIGSATINLVNSLSSNLIYILSSGPFNIANMTFDSQTDDTNVSHCAYYEVRIINLSGDTLSDIRRYYIDHYCNGYRLHFMNQFGMFDSVFLASDYKENSGIKSTYFEKLKTLSTQSRSRVRMMSVEQKSYDAEITNISDVQVAWLHELLMSTSVFWEKAGVLVPVEIDDSNNVLKQTAVKNELKISFSQSNRTFSQRG